MNKLNRRLSSFIVLYRIYTLLLTKSQVLTQQHQQRELITRACTAFNGIQDFAVGDQHVCALDLVGDLYCWGYNHRGQLGYEDTMDRIELNETLAPVNIGTGRIIKSVHAAKYFTCVHLESNDLLCWGKNGNGELGMNHQLDIGSFPNSMGDNLVLVNLGTGRKIKKFVTRYRHSCAILDNDRLKCWGLNDRGQLGLTDKSARGNHGNEMGDNLPYVGNNLTIKDVQVGVRNTCVQLFSDKLRCWGLGSYGRTGFGDTIERLYSDSLPDVDLGDTIKTFFSQHAGYCAKLSDDRVKCWGRNDYGQLGLGDRNNRGDSSGEMGNNLPFLDLGQGETVKEIKGGSFAQCALLNSNKVKCWGRASSCVLGYGDTITRGKVAKQMGDNLPYVDLGFREVQRIELLSELVCVHFLDGTLSCWGSNENSGLGLGHTNAIGCASSDMRNNLSTLGLCNVDYSHPPSSSYFPSSSPSSTQPSKLPSFSSVPSMSPSLSHFPSTVPSAFECYENVVTVELTTDINPYYTSWYFRDIHEDVIVMEVGHGYYTRKNEKYEHKHCFQSGAIEFNFQHDLAEWYGEYRLNLNDTLVEHVKPGGYFHQERKVVSYCTDDSQCDDNDICTADTCDEETRECVFTPKFSEECRKNGYAEALVIRVSSLDSVTTASKEELTESFFGNKDYVMTTQFRHCSYNNLDIRPFTGLTSTQETISGGVVDILLDMITIGEKTSVIENEVLNKANQQLGDVAAQFGFVIICIPPKSLVSGSSNWVAYAYVNSYISVYNDLSCLYPSVQMHEIGHNLGLSHSNDHENYGDSTGMMGASSKIGDGPIKCFNAPKSFELGWYLDGYMVMDIEDILMTEAELIGITDFENRGFRSTHMKIVNCQNGFDYFVSFNRKSGMNRGTGEGKDEVLVSKRVIGDYYADSTLIAKLGHNQKFTIYNLGPKGDWNLQLIPNIYLFADPVYTRISFLKWNSHCSTDSSCDDSNKCTTDKCIESDEGFGCVNTPFLDCNVCGASIHIDLRTNDSPNFITWDIHSFAQKRIIKSSIYYIDKDTPYNFHDCFEYGRYMFSLSFSDNSTGTNSNASYSLMIGNEMIDKDIITEVTYSEIIFTICNADADCFDWDGCSIDYCNIQTRVCNNSIADSSDGCTECTWIELDIVTDNFPEETNWQMNEFETNSFIFSGDPYPLFASSVFGLYREDGRRKAPSRISGRRKAPTRLSGRRKAPTRSVNLVGATYDIDDNDDIFEAVCLENNIKYHFFIKDSFGDGICCEQGDGYYHISTGNKTIFQGGDFSVYEELIFKFSSFEAGCEDNDIGTRIFYDEEIKTCIYYEVPCEDYGAVTKIFIKSDIYADDTSWTIIGGNKTVMKGDMYDVAFTEYETMGCLPFGSYSFSIYDSQENGMSSCFDHECGYEIIIGNATIIKSDGSFGETAMHVFGICNSDMDCEDSNECTHDYCDVVRHVCHFKMQCDLCNKTDVTISVRTDFLFSLTSWKLENLHGDSLTGTGGPFVKSFHLYQDTICLQKGSYEVTVMNSEGRGFTLCEPENCGFSVDVKNSTIITSDGSFSYQEKHVFGICFSDDDCDDGNLCTNDSCNIETNTCIFHQIPCRQCNKENITVQVKTDMNSRETSWSLFSPQNDASEIQGGPFSRMYSLYQKSYCVLFGEYYFTVFDQQENGFNACTETDDDCGYKVFVNGNLIVESDGSFLKNQSSILAFCDSNIDCDDNNKCTIDSCNAKTKLCEFEIDCWSCNKNTVTIDVNTNENGAKLAWYILQNRSVITSGGVYARNFAFYQHVECLPHSNLRFELLYQGNSDNLSAVSANSFGYEVKVNQENVIESKIFGTSSYEIDSSINHNWFIDFVFAENLSDHSIRLNYYLSSAIKASQFISQVLDESCTTKFFNESIIVSSNVETFKDVGKGSVDVAFDSNSIRRSVFLKNSSATFAILTFCIRSEVLLSTEVDLSVSFTETVLKVKVNFETNFEISNLESYKNNALVVEEEEQMNVNACICNDEHVCEVNPLLHQNSEILICVWEVSEQFYIFRFQNVRIYQNGILKYSPIDNGESMHFSESHGGTVGVLKTRLLTLLFEEVNPSDLSIEGNVLLTLSDYSHNRMLAEERNKANFMLRVTIVKESKNLEVLLIEISLGLFMLFFFISKNLMNRVNGNKIID